MDWKLVLTVLCLTAVTNTSTTNTSTTTSAPTTIFTKNTTSANITLTTTTTANTTSANTTTANTTTANATTANATTANATTANTTSANATTANTTTANATTANTTTANATTANATTANTTSANTTSANTTTANATTANATTANTTTANATTSNATTENSTSIATNSANTTSANTTSANTTTANSTTNTSTNDSTTNTAPVAAVYSLVFSINEPFVSALADKNSPEFAQKSRSIRNQLEANYRAIFRNFIKANILGFSNGSIVTNSSLEFSANGTIPTDATIKSILVNASTNSSLNIIPDSISVSQVIVTNTSTTNTSTTNTSTTTSAPTTISTTIEPPTPQNATAIFNLTFSIHETFDPALAKPCSSEFAKKSTNIRNQVEPLYKKAFKNFILMKIINFRSGSTITESNLYMDSSGPNVTVTQVKDIFLNGLQNLNFSVNPASIMVKQIGNSVPPVIASSVSMIWMSLLTLLLSLALHV